ncbi:MAG: TorF family putative porin [Novosphingobium sp.]
MLTSKRGLIAASMIAASLCAAAPAFADETDPPSDFTVTGSATVASQYRFRGLSQSNNQPVVQGSMTVSHASGLYVSVWGSSASSNEFVDSPIDIGGTEIDVYGGYAKELGGVKVDVGVYGYLYPGSKNLIQSTTSLTQNANYYELYGSLAKTLGPATAKVGVYYAPAQKVFNLSTFSPTRNNTYVYTDLSSGIPGTPLSIHGHLGHTGGGFDYVKQYLDYSIGVGATWKALTLDVSLVGTNVSDTDIQNWGCGASTICTTYFKRPAKTVGVVSLTAAF